MTRTHKNKKIIKNKNLYNYCFIW